MRIPTFMKTLTLTASRKSYIKYKCSKCGEDVLHEHVIEQQLTATFSSLQTDAGIEAIKSQVRKKAEEHLVQHEDELDGSINREQGYAVLGKKVKCPRCGAVQPWSKVPGPWIKSKLFFVWLFLLFSVVLSSTILIPNMRGAEAFIFIFEVLLIGSVPLWRMLKRKRLISKIDPADPSKPVYYNAGNIEELKGLLQSGGNIAVDAPTRAKFKATLNDGVKQRVPLKKGAYTFFIILISLCLLVFGGLFIIGLTDLSSGNAEVVDILTVSYGQLSTDKEYYIDNLTVLGAYAEGISKFEDGAGAAVSGSRLYFLAEFTDCDGNRCYVALDPNPGTALYKNAEAILDGETGSPVSGCFHFEDIKKLDSELVGYYNDICSELKESYSGTPLQYELVYDEADVSAYEASQRSEAKVIMYMGLVFTVPLVALLALVISKRKKSVRYYTTKEAKRLAEAASDMFKEE